MKTLHEKINKLIEQRGFFFSKTEGIQSDEDVVRLIEELLKENVQRKEDLKSLEQTAFYQGKLLLRMEKRMEKTNEYSELWQKYFTEEEIEQSKKMVRRSWALASRVGEIYRGETPRNEVEDKRHEVNVSRFDRITLILRHIGLAFVRRTPGDDTSKLNKYLRDMNGFEL
ncbi:hypothetical protein CP960_05290 [Malaciobacter halophilus]|uniref:Uncharacterized protein n=1 Tax=Malaciobacter halophilus TaxID=197482 RepID=A0A2N1J3X5_9BACT|nr:hypothetical protein [Malaciobacter halophilus]AXH08749.1 hypothetical protein AHALO_0348 [Malaciobacter halophilus]PKI81275.1 hypothetical protein CP960_05290 [Malaciobacter halophilus]